MTDQQKIEKLKFILRHQIVWYQDNKQKQEAGEIYGSYIYDNLSQQFDDLRRGDFVELLEVLLGEV